MTIHYLSFIFILYFLSPPSPSFSLLPNSKSMLKFVKIHRDLVQSSSISMNMAKHENLLNNAVQTTAGFTKLVADYSLYTKVFVSRFLYGCSMDSTYYGCHKGKCGCAFWAANMWALVLLLVMRRQRKQNSYLGGCRSRGSKVWSSSGS
ncbi:uncharacterized protein LOC110683090 isoform X2 [Chenopodium quinoa]|uniref:uncharacterized protein LOC110683090 isoform X2 n=1 Tax=Chenopodium quinoa TaxID=63459 RepID=UPI000B77866D|nr:uncharacterized protein LOC110683090 isoform X2 [Chenopodium quinoa]